MVKIISEEEFKQARDKLNEQFDRPKIEDFTKFTKFEVNWVESYKNWIETKEINIDLMNETQRVFFLAHANDKIEGKPQLVHQTIQRIPILRQVQRVIRSKGEDDKIVHGYKFIDDRYDKRYDGQEIDLVVLDFWVYRIVDKGKEHYIFSKEKLSGEHSEFYGMQINLNDTSDLNQNLKVSKITSIFIIKESKPSVCALPPDKLVDLTRRLALDLGWDEKGFMEYIFTHPDGKVYEYTEDFNLLRIAQLLSSKYEGYPLHLFKMGPVGTGKTTEAETLDFKFQEEQGILEAGTSRMRVLIPSFKEKPANLGYICNCNRIAIIDELMKMVENSINSDHVDPNNYFSGINMLLEHKKRMVGSGNDNSTIAQTTAKVSITTNNVSRKNTIYAHVGTIDPTTLSRMLVWVQDSEEIEKIYQKKDIKKSTFINKSREYNPNPDKSVCSRVFLSQVMGSGDKDSVLGNCFTSFLTIYDSCQQFLINYDEQKVYQIFNGSVSRAKDPMKQVWRARGLHHSILLLDGLTKFRCLFKDYDPTFTPIQEDYDLLERILHHMINGWDTNFDKDSWKEGLI